ncbi:MAG: sulfate transporter CysZ [Gammaproteobacteria bacterium]|nr:MAG: sulfate transporter CysZ [Gammaproteobacteria bacterium]
MTEFLAGLSYIKIGLQLLLKPGIRRYVIIPLIINTLIFTAIIIYGAGQLNDLIEAITKHWPWLEVVRWLLWPVFLLICLTIVFFCFSLATNLLCSPFNGFLSEAVQRTLTGQAPAASARTGGLLAEMRHAVKAELSKLGYFLLRAIPLLLLFLIPVIQIAAPAIWFIFASWMLSLEFLDYPMSNNGVVFSSARPILRQHRALALGFGAGVTLFAMVPVINFITIPVGVAGATRLWIDRIKN